MKSHKLHRKRIPWWQEEPWKGWWKMFRRKQSRKIAKNDTRARFREI